MAVLRFAALEHAHKRFVRRAQQGHSVPLVVLFHMRHDSNYTLATCALQQQQQQPVLDRYRAAERTVLRTSFGELRHVTGAGYHDMWPASALSQPTTDA